MRDDEFEWDALKAEENLEKHGLSFDAAEVAFKDPLAITINDPEHSDHESRFVTIGTTLFDEAIVVVHVDRSHRIRIISARYATRAERRTYMNDKNDTIHDDVDTMRPEYDFSGGVRGKYWKGPGRRLVTHMRIDQDVLQHYRTADEINAALRQLIDEGRAPKPSGE